MDQQYLGMVLASFCADALALGVHWMYDTAEITARHGRVKDFIAPASDSYHSSKKRGHFTHYGDQTLILLESIGEDGGFDLQRFGDLWRKRMQQYNGYLDKATRATMKNLEQGMDYTRSGSSSTDLGGAARIAPLLFFHRSSSEETVRYADQQTAFTHNSKAARDAASFLCRTVWYVLEGASPAAAMEKAAGKGINDIGLEMRIRSALESADMDSSDFIRQTGQACSSEGALPSVVHLVVAHQENLEEALVANVMAGGDSAARGLAVGMILGAHLGTAALPQRWLDNLAAAERIVTLLKN